MSTKFGLWVLYNARYLSREHVLFLFVLSQNDPHVHTQ